MKSRISFFSRCRSGATAVEFALVIVPLLLIVFGICEYGRLMWTREALHQTAISGARCMGIIQPGCSAGGVYNAAATTSFVRAQSAAWAIALTANDVALERTASCGGVSGFSKLTVTYSFKSLVPKLLDALGSSRQLTATACFPNALT